MKTRFCSLFKILATLSLAAPLAHAQDGTWNGTSGNWTDTAIWNSGIIANGTDSTAYFTGTDIALDRSVGLNGNRTIGNITFTDATTPSNNLAITGNTLTLDVASGTPVIDVTQAGRTLTISSIVAGNDGLQKNGAGNLTLTNANTFTGALTINGGAVALTDSKGLAEIFASTQININNGSTLSFTNGGAVNIFTGKTYTFDAGGGGSILLGTGKLPCQWQWQHLHDEWRSEKQHRTHHQRDWI